MTKYLRGNTYALPDRRRSAIYSIMQNLCPHGNKSDEIEGSLSFRIMGHIMSLRDKMEGV
jgi:hypothetical protein